MDDMAAVGPSAGMEKCCCAGPSVDVVIVESDETVEDGGRDGDAGNETASPTKVHSGVVGVTWSSEKSAAFSVALPFSALVDAVSGGGGIVVTGLREWVGSSSLSLSTICTGSPLCARSERATGRQDDADIAPRMSVWVPVDVVAVALTRRRWPPLAPVERLWVVVDVGRTGGGACGRGVAL